jgi:hypothetical protein
VVGIRARRGSFAEVHPAADLSAAMIVVRAVLRTRLQVFILGRMHTEEISERVTGAPMRPH